MLGPRERQHDAGRSRDARVHQVPTWGLTLMSDHPQWLAGPQVICLACQAQDVDRRVSEIESLADRLEGHAQVQSVTGRTTALAVSLPLVRAERFTAALALIGATTVELRVASSPSEFLVVITLESSLSEGKDT